MLTIVETNIGCGRTVPATCTATRGPNTSDEGLIEAISGGDRRAMNLLYARHSARVYRRPDQSCSSASKGCRVRIVKSLYYHQKSINEVAEIITP
jgi:hypothetical protein